MRSSRASIWAMFAGSIGRATARAIIPSRSMRIGAIGPGLVGRRRPAFRLLRAGPAQLCRRHVAGRVQWRAGRLGRRAVSASSDRGAMGETVSRARGMA